MGAITIELSDIEELVKKLKGLDRTLKKNFYFQHTDEQLQIKFESEVTGYIIVTGFLKDKQFVNILNFSFEMPFGEIVYLIRESENILDVLTP